MPVSGARDGEAAREAGVTTGYLARGLGLSPTTLRSWDRRYGLGPATRAEGRHRRWSPDDVAMLREMCRLTAAGVPPAEAAHAVRTARAARDAPPGDAGTAAGTAAGRGEGPWSVRSGPGPDRGAHSGSGLPLGSVRRECRGLARAALRMDTAAVQDLLAGAIATHGLMTAWEEVLTPALRAVGRKWAADGDRHVEVEHLMSWHISAALRHAYVRSAPRREQAADVFPVLLSCVPGEAHTLPLEALAAVLAERGLPVLMLGAAVPAEALAATMRRMGLAAVVLWSQSRATANLGLARQTAAARWGMRGARTRSPVLLCGPGWPRPARSDPDLLRPGSLREAVRMLAEPGRVPGDGPGNVPAP